MCMKSKATPSLGRSIDNLINFYFLLIYFFFHSGGSTLYNASMYLDFGTLCYYPIDPLNITASTVS